MNFPLEVPILRAIYWMLNTPGVGGVFAVLLIGGLVSAFSLALSWIVRGARQDEDVYAYPTSTLLEGEMHE